ncbi:hypothetical protein [Phaeobacter porticola]|uniref:Uncharacterized protein n=1 Tax=Phaeobacter porticola TaxID=1844006 RepID=A0A1L3I5E5_9RHOB|nr:hypothetical protein [Phaeobacter porticola]APG47370.1 hypothetical protein PhaeoP97_01962 [Phaeobacter porticola]
MQDDLPVNTSAADHPVYIIASRDYLTSCDISDTVFDTDPDAQVICHPTIKSALTDICRYGTLTAVFAEAGKTLVHQMQLDKIIAARSGQLVLLGATAEAELEAEEIGKYPWPVLCRPFSTSMIKSWLQPRQTAPDAALGNNTGDRTFISCLRVVD